MGSIPAEGHFFMIIAEPSRAEPSLSCRVDPLARGGSFARSELRFGLSAVFVRVRGNLLDEIQSMIKYKHTLHPPFKQDMLWNSKLVILLLNDPVEPSKKKIKTQEKPPDNL